MARAKRILIPTDFSLHSLQFVITVLQRQVTAPLDVVLAYGMRIGSLMTELLILSKEDYLHRLQSEDFISACQMIENGFGDKVSGLYSDLLTSDHPNYIRNYLKGNRIDEVILPEEAHYSYKERYAMDVHRPLKAYAPLVTIIHDVPSWPTPTIASEEIADLFFKNGFDVTY